MDLLENYKKAWQNQPETENKLLKKDIFKMMHARSSSIVKWIFIIGLCEFSFLTLSSIYYLFFDFQKIMKFYIDLGLTTFAFVSSIISIPILIYFLYQFYKNYKTISITENTKKLMNKILKTRKTVKNYVLFNLVYIAISLIVISIYSINHLHFKTDNNMYLGIIFTVIIATIIILVTFWLFYQLLYGILLKKLNKNYKELAKLEELN